jgi:hypothetical protein
MPENQKKAGGADWGADRAEVGAGRTRLSAPRGRHQNDRSKNSAFRCFEETVQPLDCFPATALFRLRMGAEKPKSPSSALSPELRMGDAGFALPQPSRNGVVTRPMVLSFRRAGHSARCAQPFGDDRRRVCAVCYAAFSGRRDARYCSSRCRQSCYRARKEAKQAAADLVASLIG